jgi:hypothetical protein
MNQQCLGITRSGEKCKITRNLIDGYCHLHRKRQPTTKTYETPQDGRIPSPEPEQASPPTPTASFPEHASTSPGHEPSDQKQDSMNKNALWILTGVLCIIFLMLFNLNKSDNRK